MSDILNADRVSTHVHPRVSAADRAYEILRSQIVSLELAPNESIGEQKLAQSLGVSRTPVREALARLSAEGLVDVRSRSGGVVAPIRVAAVRSAQFVREALETAIIDACSGHDNSQVIFSLHQSMEMQRFAITQNDLVLFYAADEQMHSLFCSLAGQLPVWNVIAEAKQHMDRVRRISLSQVDLGTLLDDHLELVNHVVSGNKAGAREVIRRHLRRVLIDLETIRQSHPQYFEAPTVGRVHVPP